MAPSRPQSRVPRIRLACPERDNWPTLLKHRTNARIGGILRAMLRTAGLRNWLTPSRFAIRRKALPIPGLGEGLRGLRIAVLSDFHCGAFMSTNYLCKAAGAAWAEEPDIVLLAGDFIEYHAEEAAQLADALEDLPTPPFGLFAIPGNHDYASREFPELKRILERAGARWLINESLRFERGGDAIWATGLDDMWRGRPDFDAAMAGIDLAEPRILFCHQPDVIGHARDYGYALMISGHTHGGQVVVPGLGPARVYSVNGREFIGGIKRVGATSLYVSRGLGYASLPIRFRCPAEFGLLTLVPAASTPENRRKSENHSEELFDTASESFL